MFQSKIHLKINHTLVSIHLVLSEILHQLRVRDLSVAVESH